MVSSRRTVRLFGTTFATLLLMLVGSQTAAAAPAHFGANLATNIQATPSRTCDNILFGPDGPDKCTWIEANAYKTSGSGVPGAQAPKDGKVNKIKLIACHSGSFTLFIAHFNQSTHKGSVVAQGPKITYTAACGTTTSTIQSFSIAPIQVHTGDYLAVKTSKAGFLDCFTGSLHISLFKPPLTVGGSSVTQTGDNGCYMLLEAFYKS